MLRKSIAFACSALFLLAVVTSTVLADIPETDAEHSNYGDTAKAKEYVFCLSFSLWLAPPEVMD